MSREELRVIRCPRPGGDRAVLLVNGRLTADFPPEVAVLFGRQLMSLGQQMLNDANPNNTIHDQAVLMRAGIPIGFSDNKKILSEAHNQAQHNRDLRRYMRNATGIPSKAIVGTPTLISGK